MLNTLRPDVKPRALVVQNRLLFIKAGVTALIVIDFALEQVDSQQSVIYATKQHLMLLI
jgi:hypothetical protein